MRKAGALFPGPKDSQTTDPDDRGIVHRLQIQQRALQTHDGVLLVDDWAEEGSQAIAAKHLIEQRRATFLGLAVMVDQLSDATRSLLGDGPFDRSRRGASATFLGRTCQLHLTFSCGPV
jgi:adenine/guanine phosphoribosyltransferase-like PRPP-binding protein